MESFHVHYLNKYPGGRVARSEDSLDVYDVDGNHRVAMRKNGAGMWVCASEAHGAMDVHDLAPLPKHSRVHKMVNGKIGRDEDADEREKRRQAYLDEAGKKVLSCKELEKAKKFRFDESFREIKD